MRVRTMIASIVAALSLCVPALAERCDIRCDLASTRPVCHSSSSTSTAAMQGMDGMSAPRAAMLVSQKPTCTHSNCAQPPAIRSEIRSTVTPVRSLATGSDFVSVVAARVSAVAVPLQRKPPHVQRDTPVSLHTTLLL